MRWVGWSLPGTWVARLVIAERIPGGNHKLRVDHVRSPAGEVLPVFTPYIGYSVESGEGIVI